MAIFKEKIPFVQAAKKVLTEAYSTDPPMAEKISTLAQDKAEELEKSAKGEYKVLKIILAFSLVIFIFIMAYFSGLNDKLADMYKVLIHAGEISLGGLFGILIGEAGK
jgi:hypothetical protein